MKSVYIAVDCREKTTPLPRIWRSFGYDEINWTYTPRGKGVLAEIANLSKEPYYIRCHHTFTNGNGLSMPTKGSTNVCTGIAGKELKLDFTLLDRVLETLLANNCKPIVELGFMPDALSSRRSPGPSYDYSGTDLWKYPPKDFRLWQQLVELTVRHCVEKFGDDEVATWYWEVWNEPDNPGFFGGSVKDYCKMYDFAAHAAKQAFPRIRIGGPALATSAKFLEKFLKHCSSGKNYATGYRGAPLDFISVHAKGTDWPLKGQPFRMPSLKKIMSHLNAYDSVVKRHPEYRQTEVLLDECDMAVATNFGVYDFPEFEFNNNEYYPVFLVRMTKYLMDFMQEHDFRARLFTTWAFYFEGKRFFEGNRALFTNENVRKPIFNAFVLLEKLGPHRLAFRLLNGPGASDQADFPQVDGFAACTSVDAIQVVLWNFNEHGRDAESMKVNLDLDGVQGNYLLTQFLIDKDHSNAYSAWKTLGKPDDPSGKQLNRIKLRQVLEQTGEAKEVAAQSDQIQLEFHLPGKSVVLLQFERCA